MHFGDEYLGSIAGMELLTRAVLQLYGAQGVRPIVESKVRSDSDLSNLRSMLDALRCSSVVSPMPESAPGSSERSQDGANTSAQVEVAELPSLRRWVRKEESRESKGGGSFYPPGRRWGSRTGNKQQEGQ